MSGLVLKGNTVSTTGEYLPAPYIDRIYVEDDGYRIEVSIFMPDGNNSIALGSEVITDDALASVSLNNLYYYVVVFANYSNSKSPIELILDGSETFLSYWKTAVDTVYAPSMSFSVDVSDGPETVEVDTESISYGDTPVEYQIFPVKGTPVVYYDDEGREFWKYTTKNGALATNEDGFWSETTSFSVFAFSSPIEWAEGEPIETDMEGTHDLLHDAQISDIAYEKVFEDSLIASKFQTEYMDADGAIYDQVPLQALDSFYYKITTMTHGDIVDYFQELADEFEAEYDLDTYPKLQNMLDNLALVLSTYGEKAELVPQLNALRQVTPDKTPTLPIGKLYNRFRKRIATVNKAIKDGEKLRRVVVYNGKIVDLRSPGISAESMASYEDLAPEEVIYTDWAAKATLLTDPSGEDADWERTVVAGAFLFDYEKALRRNSVISKVLDVDVLEDALISCKEDEDDPTDCIAATPHIPYKYFRITEASLKRGWYSGGASFSNQVSVTREWENSCKITSHLDTSDEIDYPLTNKIEIYTGNPTYRPLIVPDPEGASVAKPWAESLECTDYGPTIVSPDGKPSYLTARGFYDAAADPILSNSYRLLLFESMDYMGEYAQDPGEGFNASYGYYSSNMTNLEYSVYVASVTIEDTTGALLYTFYAAIEAYLETLKDYYDLCVQECAFNNDTEGFNLFFSQGMIAEYEDNIENAPWIAAAVAYVYYLDLITGLYEGDETKMATQSVEIVNQINPVNGTLAAIETFIEAFEKFVYDNFKTGTVAAAMALAEEDIPIELTYEVDLNIPTATYDTLLDTECLDEALGLCDDDSDCTAPTPICDEDRKCVAATPNKEWTKVAWMKMDVGKWAGNDEIEQIQYSMRSGWLVNEDTATAWAEAGDLFWADIYDRVANGAFEKGETYSSCDIIADGTTSTAVCDMDTWLPGGMTDPEDGPQYYYSLMTAAASEHEYGSDAAFYVGGEYDVRLEYKMVNSNQTDGVAYVYLWAYIDPDNWEGELDLDNLYGYDHVAIWVTPWLLSLTS